MSGSNDTIGVRVTTFGTADKVKQDLIAIGPAGDAAMKRVAAAAAAADPSLQKFALSADVANRAFVGLGGSLGPVGSTFAGVASVSNVLTAGLLAMGAAAGTGAVAIAKAGDAATASLQRLTGATGGLQAAQDAYEGLYRLSQQTGVAVEESAGAFARFGVAAKEIGGTNAQVLQLVGGIQKAGLAAGSSAQSTAAAVQQLGQSFASGVLQGDELRSILENMPEFAARLAKELGVSIGALKAMGAEGKLTADVVFPAALKAAQAMGEEFDKLPKTMGMASGILKEAADNFLVKLDRMTGLSEKFRDAMLAAARAIDGAATALDPGDRARAEAGVAAASGRIATLRQAIPADSEIDQSFSNQFDRIRARQRREEQVAELRQAEADLRQHQAMLRLLENDARRVRGEEASAAEAQRQQAARTRSTAELREVEESNNARVKAARVFNEEIAKINRGQENASLTPGRADQLRAAALDTYREALEKVAKEEARGGEEARKAAEKRQAVIEGLDGQTAAAQRAYAATASGIAGSKELALALQVEAKIHEAGIPLVEKRTDAEKAAAEVIERRVRGLAAVQEAQKKLEETQAKAKKYTEDSFNAVANIGETAMERVASGAVNAFLTAGGAAVSFGNVVKSVAFSAAADLAKLAIVNPFLNTVLPTSTGARPTLAASGIGGLGDLFGLGSAAGKLFGFDSSSIFGAGGFSGALAGANSYLFGTAGVAPMAGASFAEGAGATAGLLSSGGTLSLQGLFGGAGIGAGVGSFVTSLTGGNSLGGTIGGGLGGLAGAAIGSIVPGIGTVLGAIIGGAGGGGLGGLFGNSKPSSRAFSYALTGLGSEVGLTQEYYNAQGDAAFNEARTNNAAVNAYLRERGLQVSGIRAVGGNRFGMGNLQLGEAASYNEAFQSLRFTGGSNADLNRGLTDRSFANPGALQAFVDGLIQAQDAIKALSADPVPEFTAQMTALNDNFDKATAKVREYGLAEDQLAAARAKQIAALEAQRTEALRQSDVTLQLRRLAAAGSGQEADLLRQTEAARQELKTFGEQLDRWALTAEDKGRRLVELEEVQAAERAQIIARYGEQAAAALRQSGASIRQYIDNLRASPASGGSPYDVFQAANANFVRDAQLARGGDRDSLGRITSGSDALLGAARAYYGSSEGFQQTLDRVLFNLEGLPAVKSYDALQLEELQRIAGAVTAGGDAATAAAIQAQTAATAAGLAAVSNAASAGNAVLSRIEAAAAAGNVITADFARANAAGTVALGAYLTAANDYAAAGNVITADFSKASGDYLAAANNYGAATNGYLAAANIAHNAGNTILGEFSRANAAGLTAANTIAFDVGNATVAAMNASNTIAAQASQAVVTAVNSVATQVAALAVRLDTLEAAVRASGVTVATETRNGLARTVDELIAANGTLKRLVA
jgi:tape measure domain-containing protein